MVLIKTIVNFETFTTVNTKTIVVIEGRSHHASKKKSFPRQFLKHRGIMSQ